MPLGSAMMERRAQQRRRVLKAGSIVLNNRSSILSCTVRNMSTAGALLQIPTTLTVPLEFALAIDAGRAAPCRVAWQDGHQVGVAFR